MKKAFAFIMLLAIIVLASCSGGKNPVDSPDDGTYTITGKVNVGNSGLADVSVSIAGNSVSKTAMTSSDGAYAFSGLVNGSYTIIPSKSGYVFEPSSLGMTVNNSDKTAGIIIATKAQGYAISGRVNFESGGAFAGASIRLTGNNVDRTATTDSDGAYGFYNLLDGSYTITPSKTDYSFNPAVITVTLSGYGKVVDPITAVKSGNPTHEISGITFVRIPGGIFQMGAADDDDGFDAKLYRPVHTVTVSAFEIGAYEITNKIYAIYLNAALASGDITVSDFGARKEVFGNAGDYKGKVYLLIINSSSGDNRCWITYTNGSFSVSSSKEDWPVVNVSWFGAKAFADYYRLSLPREAEWEYACRGGKQRKYGTSYDFSTLPNQVPGPAFMNFTFESWTPVGHPTEVGSYRGNDFGLYDMSGNVSEWCQDWFELYTAESVIDPTGPQTGSGRILRGGSWSDGQHACRSASRGMTNDYYTSLSLGFRVVRR